MNLSTKTRDLLWGMTLIAGACLYRPLVFWAENAWDLASPEDVFATTSIGVLAGWAILYVLTRASLPPLPTSIPIAGLSFIAFNWAQTGILNPWFWVGLVGAASVAAYSFLTEKTLRRISVVALALLVAAPAFQVMLQHYQQRVSYPLNPISQPAEVSPTGAVEDVLVVIVDSYPMLAVADEWFDHDTKPLETRLTRAGFDVARVAWSHNTFTGLAVPSILQLEQMANASPKGSWGNLSTNYQLARGGNFTAKTLKEAGYTYTHIEPGWDGAVCGPVVDNCLETVWLDESNWNLLAPSVLGSFFNSQFGSVEAGSTLRTVNHLTRLSIFDDGNHDYVYSHLMLPHIPYVVDADCSVLPPRDRNDGSHTHRPLRRQLQCVDSLLSQVVESVGKRTAVLISGDHGTGLGEPSQSASEGWTDAHVAERLGVLLAYKLPFGCREPVSQTNIYVMRSIIQCAVHADVPTETAKFMLGAQQPTEIEPERLARIEDSLVSGQLQQDG